MRRNLGARWATVWIAVALLATGCSFAEKEQPPPPAAPGATPGGTLTVGITPPGPIEPTVAASEPGLLIASTLCDTLVHLDPATGKLEPGIAKSWLVTDNGSITFKLREDLRFHQSGETLTAADVVYSLERLANPAEGSYLADVIEPIAGWEQFRSDEDDEDHATRLVGAQAIDEYALQVQLITTDQDAVRMFAHPATAPINSAAVEVNPVAFARQPSCVGPYQLAEPTKDDVTTIRLERDPHYDAGDVAYTGGGSGYADNISFRTYPSDAAAGTAWRQGKVDIVNVPTSEAISLLKSRTTATKLIHGPSPAVELIGLPSGAPGALAGLGEAAVRQALSLGLDRTRLAKVVYGSTRIPATGFVPPRVTGVARTCEKTVPAKPDLDTANRLLSDAGVTLAGKTLPIYYNDEYTNARLVGEVASQWGDAFGLKAEPEAVSWEELLDKTLGSGIDGAFRVSWAPDVLAQGNYLVPLVSDTEDGPNLGRFAAPVIDNTLTNLAFAEGGDRSIYVDKLSSQVCDELPAIPLLFGRTHWLIRTENIDPARDDVIDPSGRLLLRELYVPTT